MKQMLKISIILLAALLLTSCGNSPKNEESIWQDLKSNNPQLIIANPKKQDYQITKRQTNTDEKTDYVYIDITESNASFSASASYLMTYKLYNEGWLLESVSESNRSVIPTEPPTDDQVFLDSICAILNRDSVPLIDTAYIERYQKEVDEGLLSFGDHTRASDTTYVAYAAHTEENTCVDIKTIYEVLYQFDPYSLLWTTESRNQISQEYVWHLEGTTWTQGGHLYDGERIPNTKITILSFDPEKMELSFAESKRGWGNEYSHYKQTIPVEFNEGYFDSKTILYGDADGHNSFGIPAVLEIRPHAMFYNRNIMYLSE